MKLNGTLIPVLVLALAATAGVAWAAGEEKPVCPVTGETTTCTGDGPHGPHGTAGDTPVCTGHHPRGPHGLTGPHHQPARMAAALDLTDEQREAMREILASERQAVRERMESALAAILTPEQQEQLEAIKARRETRAGQDRPGRKGRAGRRGPEDKDRGEMAVQRLERMTEHLDLTPDQQDQISQILEEAAPSPRSEVRDRIRKVLTPEQQETMDQRRLHPGMGQNPHPRGPAGEGRGFPAHLEQLQLTDEQRQAVHEVMTEIHAEQRSQARSRIEALLTSEQLEKLEQLHK